MAGNPITATSFSEFIKTTYLESGLIETMITDGVKDPFVEMLERDFECYGDFVKVPIVTATNVRASADFATAQNLNSNTLGQAFLVPPTQINVLGSFDQPTLKASTSGNGNSFMSVVDLVMKSSANAMNKKIATFVHRDGYGWTSSVATGAAVNLASGYLQLANQSDVLLFEQGDVLVVSATPGGALRVGSLTITGIDYGASSLIFASAPNVGITLIAAGDVIFRSAGDAYAFNSAFQCLFGLQAWIPLPAYGSNTSTVGALTVVFCSVTRSTNQLRLAGQYFNNNAALGGAGNPYPEALANACSYLMATMTDPSLVDVIIMNPFDYRGLTNSASSKLVALSGGDAQTKARVSMANFGVVTDSGVIPVKTSVFCPQGYAEILSTSTFFLASSGKPGLQEEDGLVVRAVYNAAQWETRWSYDNVNLCCKAPGYNAIVQL